MIPDKIKTPADISAGLALLAPIRFPFSFLSSLLSFPKH